MSLAGRLRAEAGWALAALFPVLLPVGTAFNVPVVAMAVAGAVLLARRGRALARDPALRFCSVLFLCMWVPMLLSLPDAVYPPRALSTTLEFPRFGLMAVFVAAVLAAEEKRRRLLAVTLGLLAFWTLDGCLQFAVGRDLFGDPLVNGSVTGVFYPDLRIGHVLSVMSPIGFEAVRRLAARRRAAWLLLLPLLVVIVGTGNRNSWALLALSVLVWFPAAAWMAGWRIPARRAAAGLALALAVIAAGVGLSTRVQHRLEQTAALLEFSRAGFEEATGHRLAIWEPAWRMFEAHWLNGIGPRGFRYVFADYARPDNFWLQEGREGQTHPHQTLLEFAAETGVPGLAGFAAFYALVLARLRRAGADGARQAFAWLLAVALAMFPLSMHHAFYSTFWSSFTWWLLVVGAAMPLRPDGEGAVPAAAPSPA